MSVTPRSSWMSLADILADVKLGVRESTISDSEYTLYINRAYKFLFYDAKWEERISTDVITLVADQSTYEVPTTADDIIIVKSATGLFLPESEITHYVEFGYTSSAGNVYRVRFRGVNVEIFPTPTAGDAGNNLDITFYRELCRYDSIGDIQAGPLSADTDYPLLHPSVHPVISLLAQIYAMEDTREEAMATATKVGRYKTELKSCKYNVLARTKYPNVSRVFR